MSHLVGLAMVHYLLTCYTTGSQAGRTVVRVEFFFEGFLFYAHPSIGSFQQPVIGAYYRLKNVSPYDGRPTTRTKTLYVR